MTEEAEKGISRILSIEETFPAEFITHLRAGEKVNWGMYISQLGKIESEAFLASLAQKSILSGKWETCPFSPVAYKNDSHYRRTINVLMGDPHRILKLNGDIETGDELSITARGTQLLREMVEESFGRYGVSKNKVAENAKETTPAEGSTELEQMIDKVAQAFSLLATPDEFLKNNAPEIKVTREFRIQLSQVIALLKTDNLANQLMAKIKLEQLILGKDPAFYEKFLEILSNVAKHADELRMIFHQRSKKQKRRAREKKSHIETNHFNCALSSARLRELEKYELFLVVFDKDISIKISDLQTKELAAQQALQSTFSVQNNSAISTFIQDVQKLYNSYFETTLDS